MDMAPPSVERSEPLWPIYLAYLFIVVGGWATALFLIFGLLAGVVTYAVGIAIGGLWFFIREALFGAP